MEEVYCGYSKYVRGKIEKLEREEEIRQYCLERGYNLFSIWSDSAGVTDGLKAAVSVIQKGLAKGLVVSARTISNIKVPEGVCIIPSSRLHLFRGGWVAFGWQLENGMLVEHPDEQQVISTLRIGKESGLSWLQLATALNKQCVNRRNGKPWNRSSVYQIMKVNPLRGE